MKMHSASPFLPAIVVSMSLIVGAVAHAVGPATATPTPTPTAAPHPTTAPTPNNPLTPYIWPFQYVISGPATAHSGDTVTYEVSYQRDSSEAKDQASFVLSWTLNAATSFSLKTVAGTTAAVEFQADGQAFVGIPTQQGQGLVEVTLGLASSFKGTFTMGIDVQGTGITMPQGSVLVANTLVSPVTQQLSPPTTGTGSPSHSAWPKAGVALLIAAAFAAGLGATLPLPYRRR